MPQETPSTHVGDYELSAEEQVGFRQGINASAAYLRLSAERGLMHPLLAHHLREYADRLERLRMVIQ